MGYQKKNDFGTSKKNGLSDNKKVFGLFLSFSILLLLSISAMIAPVSTSERASIEPLVDYLKIDTVIDNNYAVTEIEEMFKNPYNRSLEHTFTFSIPEKAFISNFSLTLDNEIHYATIVPKDIGRERYENAKVNGSDVGLMEAKGKNIFSYSVSLSPFQMVKVGLRYEQFLEKALGGYVYIIPLSGNNLNRNIKLFSIDILIKSFESITDVSLENYIEKDHIDFPRPNIAEIFFTFDSGIPQDDFIMTYKTNSPPINGTILNYNDGNEEFFLHIFSPQKSDLGGSGMDKEIIFVLDKSGSMQGTKIEQLKTAFEEVIGQLPNRDSMNIITFDNTINEYKEELFSASETNKDSAVTYINKVSAGGSTNINDALTNALEMFEYSETKVPIIVMLTDGLPTAGVTNTMTIRENIMKTNTAKVAIFSLGFGYDLDFEFLKAMSLENYGIALRIYEGSDASEQITDFYDTISTPLLRDLSFSYSDGAYEVYPHKVDQLFEGAEVAVVGKTNGEYNELTSNVEATSWEGTKKFKETFELVENSNHSFIPRLWAYAKIKHLLDEIAVNGEKVNLVENVTELAMKYSFVTPYTSLLVEITDDADKPEDKLDEDNDDESDPLVDRIDGSTNKPNDGPPSKDKKTDGDGNGEKAEDSDDDTAYKISEGASEALGISNSLICFPVLLLIFLLVIIILIARKVSKNKDKKDKN